MSNILDVPLPKKRIRLAFSRLLTLGLLIFISILGVVGLGGLFFFIEDFFWRFGRGKELLSDDWFVLLLCPLITCAFYILSAALFLRISPGRIQIIAVEITEKQHNLIGDVFYWFKGAKIARIIKLLPFIVPPISLALIHAPEQRFNCSAFRKKSHKILYLDEGRHIAIAAEKCWRGGAVLLDENLTHLRLNKQDKQQLLASLRKLQKELARNPERLNKIVSGITRVENRRMFRWDEKRKKYERI